MDFSGKFFGMEEGKCYKSVHKDYAIAEACNLLCLALCTSAIGNKTYDDENIKIVKKFLADYDYGVYYENSVVRKEAYNNFRNECMPDIVSNARFLLKNGKLNEEKWLPIIKDFFIKANEYLEEGKDLKED